MSDHWHVLEPHEDIGGRAPYAVQRNRHSDDLVIIVRPASIVRALARSYSDSCHGSVVRTVALEDGRIAVSDEYTLKDGDLLPVVPGGTPGFRLGLGGIQVPSIELGTPEAYARSVALLQTLQALAPLEMTDHGFLGHVRHFLYTEEIDRLRALPADVR